MKMSDKQEVNKSTDAVMTVSSPDEFRHEVLVAIQRAQQNAELSQRPFDFEYVQQDRHDNLRIYIADGYLDVFYANKDTRPITSPLRHAIESLAQLDNQTFRVEITDVYRSERLLSAQLGHPVLPSENDTPWHRIETISEQKRSEHVKEPVIQVEAPASATKSSESFLHRVVSRFASKEEEKESDKNDQSPKLK